MKIFQSHPVQSAVSYLSIGLMAATSLAFAQDTGSSGGWRRVGDPAPTDQSSYPTYPASQAPRDQEPAYGGDPAGDSGQPPYQQPADQQPDYSQQPPYRQQQPGYNQQQPRYQPPPVPAHLNVPAGTFLTVRVNQVLSSDRNQPGDAFFANLVEPLVANGVVLAEPGQTIGGRVVEAQKAGRVEGVARLGVELTSLSLVDGQQLPIRSQLISRRGDTSVGRDAGAIVGTTALGAAIGAAAGWGTGAAIGAGAGLAAGAIGVLVTRGQASVIHPEQLLTFRLQTPLTVFTNNSPQAFRYIQPGEYDRPQSYDPGPGTYASAAPRPAPYYGYGYPYPYYDYAFGYPYWRPSIGFYWGNGYWGGRDWDRGRGYYGRGYYGHGGGHHR